MGERTRFLKNHIVSKGASENQNGKLGDILKEDTELALILNLDELLRAVRRVGNVQLFFRGPNVSIFFDEK